MNRSGPEAADIRSLRESRRSGGRLVFVDRLTAGAAIRIAAFRHPPTRIVSFEPPAMGGALLARMFRRLGRFPVQSERVTAHTGEIRREDGSAEYPELYRTGRAITAELRKSELDGDPILLRLRHVWDEEKVALHLEKLAEPWIQLEVLRIRMARWLADRSEDPELETYLLIPRHPWNACLRPFAASHNVRLLDYFARPRSPGAGRMAASAARQFRIAARRIVRPSAAATGRADSSFATPEQPTPSVAARFWYRDLSLDPSTRSEFFWLDEADLDPRRLIIYDVPPEKLPPSSTIEELRARGVRIETRTGIALHRYGFQRLVTYLGCIGRATAGAFVAGERVRPRVLVELLKLAVKVGYWEEFFAARGVRLHVGTLNTEVAQVLALDSIGGISVAYQYSIAMLSTGSTTLLTAGEDVQFVCSPVFGRIWEDLGTRPRYCINSGFPYGSAVQRLRGSARSRELRQEMLDAGARFILCFFDENSVQRWDVPASDEDAASDYSSLLRWVLEDESLGLIVKVKKAETFDERLASIKDLLDQARATGRCRITADTMALHHLYPAEAAQVADLAIGKLLGATAALEAAAVGVPVVLVCVEGFSSHPFWRASAPRVYDSWTRLRSDVEEFRESCEIESRFGNWAGESQLIDPRDTGGTERLARYIGHLFRPLAAGEGKHLALGSAARRFSFEYGDDRVLWRPGVETMTVDDSAPGTAHSRGAVYHGGETARVASE